MTSLPSSGVASSLPTLPPTLGPSFSAKRKQPPPSALSRSSHLFHPYRSIGHIIGHHPFHLSTLGSARFLHSITGRTFQIFNLDRLRIVLTSQPAPHPLLCLTSAGRDLTACGSGSELVIYRRQEVVQRLSGHTTDVYLVQQWGRHHLLTVDEAQVMKVWDMRKMQLTREREYGAWKQPLKQEPDSLPPPSPLHTDPEGEDTAGEGAERAEGGETMKEEGPSAGSHPSCIATIPLRVFHLAPTATSSSTQPLLLPSTSRLTCVLHPPTYVNKLLLAFSTGLLLLYNLHTQTAIHAYYPIQTYHSSLPTSSSPAPPTPSSSPLPLGPAAGHASSAITALTASPSPGVISLGTSTGLILQFSIDSSTVLSAFHQHWGEVTALSYRQDGHPHLLSATPQGHLCTWHLGDWDASASPPAWRRRPAFHSLTPHCHEGGVVAATYLPHEPIVVTSGKDNALRMYSVEGVEGTMRLLKSRTGHTRHPRFLRWMGREETNKSSDALLLTGGDGGQMHLWSLRRDEESRELGRRKIAAKSRRQLMIDGEGAGAGEELPSIAAFAVSQTPRAKDYANVLSVHAGDAAARGWSTETGSVSALAFVNPLQALSAAKAVEVSVCGQWGVVGRAAGRLEMYAMESGNLRGQFPEPALTQTRRRPRKGHLHTLDDLIKGEAVHLWGVKRDETKDGAEGDEGKEGKERKEGKEGQKGKAGGGGAHTAAVTGVQMDGMNQWLVSASLDGTVKVWDVATRVCVHTLTLPSPASHLLYHRQNDLFAVSTDAYELLVYDNSSTSPTSPPTLIRRFAGHRGPVTDLAFSPRGHLLLSSALDGTVLVHHLPSSVLVDVLRFSAAVMSLAMSPLGDMVATSHVGSVGVMLWMSKEWVGEGWEEVRQGEEVEMEDDDPTPTTLTTPAPALPTTPTPDGPTFGLITFSSLPRHRWHALLHLDELKERNRAKEADLTRNPSAPFFLHSLVTDPKAVVEPVESSRVRRRGVEAVEPEVIGLLRAGRTAARASDGSVAALYAAYEGVTQHLLGLSVAGLDGMLQGLGGHERQGEWFALWLEYLVAAVRSCRYYEFLQGVQLRLLQLHGREMIKEGPEVKALIAQLAAVQRAGWERLERALMKNTALVNHLANIT